MSQNLVACRSGENLIRGKSGHGSVWTVPEVVALKHDQESKITGQISELSLENLCVQSSNRWRIYSFSTKWFDLLLMTRARKANNFLWKISAVSATMWTTGEFRLLQSIISNILISDLHNVQQSAPHCSVDLGVSLQQLAPQCFSSQCTVSTALFSIQYLTVLQLMPCSAFSTSLFSIQYLTV